MRARIAFLLTFLVELVAVLSLFATLAAALFIAHGLGF